MFQLAVILVIFCVCSSFAANTDRIVNGETASIINFPYQCSIQEFNQHFCGGSIIAATFILTAAHCFEGTDPSQKKNMQVRFGSSQYNSGGVVRGVKAWHMHPGWNNVTMVDDMCLLELDSPSVNSASMKPISLATETPKTGASVTVTGWGATKEGDSTTPVVLQKTDLEFQTREDCASNFKYKKGDILDGMVCAAGAGTDSCQGDSGGPLAMEDPKTGQMTLVGVVSWGYGCAKDGYPGVYADVPQYGQWITQTMKQITKASFF